MLDGVSRSGQSHGPAHPVDEIGTLPGVDVVGIPASFGVTSIGPEDGPAPLEGADLGHDPDVMSGRFPGGQKLLHHGDGLFFVELGRHRSAMIDDDAGQTVDGVFGRVWM